jgi:seryl-tRNA synthetase
MRAQHKGGEGMAEHEIREECRTWRENLERRMEEAEVVGKKVTSEVSDHKSDITGLKSDMKHLTDSIKGQTKAIWGMVAMIMTALVGFFFWYVESGAH